MHRLLWILCIATFPFTLAQTSNIKNKYILQLNSKTTLSGADVASIHTLQTSLDACLTLAGVSFETTTNYSKIFAGRAITLTNDDDLTALQKCPEVGKVWPLRTIPAPSAVFGGPVRPMQYYTHNLTGVTHARDALGLSGSGIKSKYN